MLAESTNDSEEVKERIRDKFDGAGTVPIPDRSLWISSSSFSGACYPFERAEVGVEKPVFLTLKF